MISFLKNQFRNLLFRLFGPKGFSKYISSLSESPTYSKFCKQVYGIDLCQLNMADKEQLEKLIEVIALKPNDHLLDLGCGAGRISEYISDACQANVVAIDFAKGPIESARKRTVQKADRLKFELGNLNSIDQAEQSFDVVTSFDTLYFVSDLPKVLQKINSLLKPQGRMAIFFSASLKPGQSPEFLQPEKTTLGLALTAMKLSFKTWDFTKNETLIWKKSLEVAEALKAEFELENNRKIYESRIDEASRMLKKLEDQRIARFLYLVYQES